MVKQKRRPISFLELVRSQGVSQLPAADAAIVETFASIPEKKTDVPENFFEPSSHQSELKDLVQEMEFHDCSHSQLTPQTQSLEEVLRVPEANTCQVSDLSQSNSMFRSPANHSYIQAPWIKKLPVSTSAQLPTDKCGLSESSETTRPILKGRQ